MASKPLRLWASASACNHSPCAQQPCSDLGKQGLGLTFFLLFQCPRGSLGFMARNGEGQGAAPRVCTSPRSPCRGGRASGQSPKAIRVEHLLTPPSCNAQSCLKGPPRPPEPQAAALGVGDHEQPHPPPRPGKWHLPGVCCGCGTPTPRSPVGQLHSEPWSRHSPRAHIGIFSFYCTFIGTPSTAPRAGISARREQGLFSSPAREEEQHPAAAGGGRHPPHITAPSLPLLP